MRWRRLGGAFVFRRQAFEAARSGGRIDKYLHDELDLMREAANTSQLGRNFQNSDMLIVPKVFYDYTGDVLTIRWMDGTPVSILPDSKPTASVCTNLPITAWKSSSASFPRRLFFHADMHPAILVAADNRPHRPRFGIVSA